MLGCATTAVTRLNMLGRLATTRGKEAKKPPPSRERGDSSLGKRTHTRLVGCAVPKPSSAKSKVSCMPKVNGPTCVPNNPILGPPTTDRETHLPIPSQANYKHHSNDSTKKESTGSPNRHQLQQPNKSTDLVFSKPTFLPTNLRDGQTGEDTRTKKPPDLVEL